jgi:hypothetical protein
VEVEILSFPYIECDLFFAECQSEDFTQIESPEYEISTSGTHTPTFVSKVAKGIHGVWSSRLDDLLHLGIMPMKILHILNQEADAATKSLLPSLKQIYNRKRTVFKSRAQLDLQHTLDIFMRKRMVCMSSILCSILYFYFTDQLIRDIRYLCIEWHAFCT